MRSLYSVVFYRKPDVIKLIELSNQKLSLSSDKFLTVQNII